MATNNNSLQESAQEIQKRPMRYYLQPLGGVNPFRPIGYTVDGQSSMTQSTTSTTYDTEQQKKVLQSIDTIERNFTIAALKTNVDMLQVAFLDSVIQDGVMYFGQSGTVRAQEYALMAVSVNKDENGNYNVLYLRRVTCDGNFTINFNQTEYQNIPLNFILLNAEGIDTGSTGVFFKSKIDQPNEIQIPGLNAAQTLSVQSISPADGSSTAKTTDLIYVTYNAPVEFFGSQVLNKAASGTKTPVEFTSNQNRTVKGTAQPGSTMTSLIHEGDAFPASAFVNAKIRLSLKGKIDAEVETTVTAYNTGTKTFTLAQSGITQDISGMQYEILAGYAVYTPQSLSASSTYEFLTANERDVNNNLISPVISGSRFQTATA